MKYITYKRKKFKPGTAKTIETADSIIHEYKAQGYTLNLRQLYYQFVARGIIPNETVQYDRLVRVITEGRMAGLLPWDGIEDKTRSISSWLIEEDEQEVFADVEYGLALDFWERQGVYIEAWVEKDALGDVLRKPCMANKVPYMACRGYMSASAIWRAGQRFMRHRDAGREVILIHLGDHDPSGIDMTRDNAERLRLFSEGEVEIRRIALNMDQVEEHRPPPNPAKLTDSRIGAYLDEYGSQSWELDALEPKIITKLVEDEIHEFIDPEVWNDTNAEQDKRREKIAQVYEHWYEIADFIDTLNEEE